MCFTTTLLLAVLASGGQSFAQSCYWPDRSVDNTSTPCNAGATNSHCCGVGDVCLDNTYCFKQGDFGNRMYRGSCTDKTWSSVACPYECFEAVPNHGISLFPIADTVIGTYCCGPGWNVTSNQCTTGSRDTYLPFSLPNANVIFNRTSGSTGPNSTNVVATATNTVTSTSTSLTTTKPKHKNSHDAAIGAGVGIPLGLIIVGAGLLLWHQARCTKKLQWRLDNYDTKFRTLAPLTSYQTVPTSDHAMQQTTSYEMQASLLDSTSGELGGQPVAELEQREQRSRRW